MQIPQVESVDPVKGLVAALPIGSLTFHKCLPVFISLFIEVGCGSFGLRFVAAAGTPLIHEPSQFQLGQAIPGLGALGALHGGARRLRPI